MIITLDGEPAGIAGLIRDQGLLVYFTEYKESLAPMLKDIRVLRPALTVMGWVKRARIPVVAQAEHEQGAKHLERLGFVHTNREWYAWPR